MLDYQRVYLYEMLLNKEMNMQQKNNRDPLDLQQSYMIKNPSPYGNRCINIVDMLHCHEWYLLLEFSWTSNQWFNMAIHGYT